MNSQWEKDAKWRRENRSWLNISQKISLAVLNKLRILEITKEDLKEKLGISSEEMDLLVKGQLDCSLSLLSKLESILGIKITITWQ